MLSCVFLAATPVLFCGCGGDITPIQKTGRQIRDSITGKMQEQQLPVNYREAGKLQATVEAGKENKLDFAITR